ncbi:MAG TPA: galactokinase [Gemmataceae bacterium]|jgi:galactokinase|nr:galactokinase [Gemmataceae bacterium]
MNDFQALFGRPPAVRADAPGRVNLIGEHTDYNGGLVLPTAIPQRTRVELAPRPDQSVRVWSEGQTPAPLQYALGAETPGRGWLDYVQGVTRILGQGGYALGGFDARIESNVPLGSGLSSSAALTVSLMRALRGAFALILDDVEIARMGQRVENEFVGARVGIMDPMAASLADEGTALFLDARSLAYERVPLPAGADLVVVHSGVTHNHAAGDYNRRRAECERACALLGTAQLRDLTSADLPRVMALPEPLGRRARHVITENERVVAAVSAMRAGDLPRLGALFYQSHHSMRDDYEVSVPAIDLIVELARRETSVYGARLTGGGFGGSVVMLAHAGTGQKAAQRIARAYEDRSGHHAKVLVPEG